LVIARPGSPSIMLRSDAGSLNGAVSERPRVVESWDLLDNPRIAIGAANAQNDPSCALGSGPV